VKNRVRFVLVKKNNNRKLTLWFRPVIPALGRLRQKVKKKRKRKREK
jgi:hypothetical protein